MKKNYILDFDGTLTNIEEDTTDWQKKYPGVCSEILGISLNFILPIYHKIKDNLKDSPEKGFIIAGYDALPANSDPYIRSQAAMQGVLKEIKLNGPSLTSKLPEDETKFLIDAYIKTTGIANNKVCFREGIKDFLEDMKQRYNLAIVTNSKEEKVLKGLEKISVSGIPVFGDAKKLFIDKKLQNFLPTIKSGNFPREVLLGRKGYWDILNTLSEQGFEWKNTTVVGDIYELDLALPDYLNYSIIQINNGSAPEHEKEYLGKNFVENLNELRKLVL